MAKIRIKDLAFIRHDSVVMVDGCLEEAVRAGRYDLPDCWNPFRWERGQAAPTTEATVVGGVGEDQIVSYSSKCALRVE